MLTKDRVASVIRTPFVENQARACHGEVSGEPRGSGVRRAVGELLTCPHYLGQWIAAGLGVGMVAAPEVTRFGHLRLQRPGDQRLPPARLPGLHRRRRLAADPRLRARAAQSAGSDGSDSA